MRKILILLVLVVLLTACNNQEKIEDCVILDIPQNWEFAGWGSTIGSKYSQAICKQVDGPIYATCPYHEIDCP